MLGLLFCLMIDLIDYFGCFVLIVCFSVVVFCSVVGWVFPELLLLCVLLRIGWVVCWVITYF